jgi:hypothetical protein
LKDSDLTHGAGFAGQRQKPLGPCPSSRSLLTPSQLI